MTPIDRRAFLAAAGASAAMSAAKAIAASAAGEGSERAAHPGDDHRGPAVIASANGLKTVELAFARVAAGVDPLLAAVEGVGLVEADPDDMSVGYGGLPNERGVVQLDSSVMHGPTHRAGAVAALENIVHPARVALKVLQTTDHCLLVGQGALDFARAHGFPEQNLLTDRARAAWLKWKHNLSPADDWLDDDQTDWPEDQAPQTRLDHPPPGWPEGVPFTWGTIHCSAVTGAGDLGSCTTTSGLSFKIPGRVGDSPIVGAGMFCDNAVGAAGATGRGEAVIESCGAFDAVREMERGATPTEACLAVLRRIAERSTRQRRLVERGVPNFNVTMYALRKDGAFGSAALRGPAGGAPFAVCTAAGARIEHAPVLFVV
jgi:N4-(beta-N-acetylglucosaminyl)-L-asparaginase